MNLKRFFSIDRCNCVKCPIVNFVPFALHVTHKSLPAKNPHVLWFIRNMMHLRGFQKKSSFLMLLLEIFKLVYANSLRVHDTQGYIRLGICQWKSF